MIELMASFKELKPGRILGVVGSLLVCVGGFLPWYEYSGDSSFTQSSSICAGIAFVILGIAGIILIMRGKPETAVGGFVLGVVGCILPSLGMVDSLSLSSQGIYLSYGIYVTFIGSCLLSAGSVIAFREAKEDERVAREAERTRKTKMARNLMVAERFEDAARLYDSLGMWKQAGEARRIAKRHVVTQIHLNVNDLIEQMRRGGLTTTYACPSCSGPIEITGSTSLSSLSRCQYCGKVIQTTDIAMFLAKVIGRE